MEANAGSSAVLQAPGRPPSTWRRFCLLAAMLGVVGAGSGCSAGQAASPTLAPLPTTTASTTPTGAAATPPPALPSDSSSTGAGAPPPATPLTREGAETFARYWFEEFDRAYTRLDPAIIAGITTAECVSCQAYIANLDRVKAAGESYRGGERLLRFVVAAPLEGELVSVLVTYSTRELLVVDATGAIARRIPAEEKAVVDVDLRRMASSWVVKEVTRV